MQKTIEKPSRDREGAENLHKPNRDCTGAENYHNPSHDREGAENHLLTAALLVSHPTLASRGAEYER